MIKEQAATNYQLVISIVLYQTDEIVIQKLLNCVHSSKLENYLIHIVDNSPTKVSYYQKLKEAKNTQYYHPQSNLGYGAGHNITINKYAQYSDYILILNPDVEFDSTLLPILLERMSSQQDIGLASVRILNTQQNIQYVHRRFPSVYDLFVRELSYHQCFIRYLFSSQIEAQEMRKYYHQSGNTSFSAEMVSGCFMLFRANILRQIGGFDERFFMYCEDVDISKRAKKIAQNTIFTDLYVIHHWARESKKSKDMFLMHLKSWYRYFIKHNLDN